ncbi:MAG: hypothetical protein PUE27_05360 [Sharpea porci]|uniref:hypothetical protein n=1 Tax=Sharpea porci TaxID=2652286 RepID=UPI00240A92FF|nr:hypothetical protein [Sharpea porci]MDD6711494.1 hypothetical protein [Sharpea porci]
MNEKLRAVLYVLIPSVIYTLYSRYIPTITTYITTRIPLTSEQARIMIFMLMGVVLYLTYNMAIHKRILYRVVNIIHIVIGLFPLYASYLANIPYVNEYMRILGDAYVIVELVAGVGIVNMIESFR